MASHRTEVNRIYAQDSAAAKVSAGFSIEFARKALGVGCVHMLSLFPDAELAFDPVLVSGLKLNYRT